MPYDGYMSGYQQNPNTILQQLAYLQANPGYQSPYGNPNSRFNVSNIATQQPNLNGGLAQYQTIPTSQGGTGQQQLMQQPVD